MRQVPPRRFESGDGRWIATLDVDPHGLSASHGIVFETDVDDLDEYQGAWVELATGDLVFLMYSPYLRVMSVMVDIGADDVACREETLRALNLDSAAVTWTPDYVVRGSWRLMRADKLLGTFVLSTLGTVEWSMYQGTFKSTPSFQDLGALFEDLGRRLDDSWRAALQEPDQEQHVREFLRACRDAAKQFQGAGVRIEHLPECRDVGEFALSLRPGRTGFWSGWLRPLR